ncbi:DUF4139 domain-containing protein [Hymenobacter aquaticus]|uniref:DUF4139 domain-containing protein n=1 Tax=Hymenobacter aquaticus TaxID=1867101 RepID=A0A4Z0Q531_9BACT|nr:DUF4139 domain-containing protein [Hymenobacter aquaticus]TGE24253.1 DUF4139 domain-containing protein [Hymenobacter aquaticus]
MYSIPLFRMRYRYWLLLLLFSVIYRRGAAQTAPVPVRPALTTVTVYLNGTALEHQARVPLAAGLNRLALLGVSPKINPETLEIELGDGAEVLSLGPDDAPAGPVALNTSAVDSLTRATEELRRTEAELQGLDQEKAFLLANRTVAAGPQASWSAEVQRGATLLRTRLVAIQLETNRLQTQQARLLAQTTALQPRAAATGADNRLVLLVRAERALTVPLTLRYYVASRAPWQPRLDIRADASGQQLQFVPHGVLRNQSGLAWERVRVVLMRHNLGEDVSRPVLEPWALDFDGGDHIGEGRIDQFVVKGTAKGKPVEVPQSTRYEVPEAVTLASGGRRELALPPVRLAARPEYLAIPRLSEQVFLQAKVTGWEGLQLPEEASVYHQGSYVGTTELNERAYNDSLEVALGHDAQLVVGRAKLEDFSGNVPLSDKRRVRLTYELNVRNNHAAAVRIRILDQVPISEEKEIEVKVLNTGGARLDERTGKLTWVLTLPPGASQRLQFGFQVDYPQNRPVEIIKHQTRISSPKFR